MKFIHQWIWIVLVAFCVIGLIYPSIGVIALICMLAPVAMAFFRGRKWCGSFCPRGSFNDTIISKISRNKKVPKILKTTWFRILFMCLLFGFFAWQLILTWGNINSVGAVFVRMILITTGLAILLGMIYKPRAWCMICPMGTMASYATKLGSKKRVVLDQEKCVGCKLCTKKCPMEIEVHSGEAALNTDCIKCKVCVYSCKKNALEIQ